MTQKPTRADVAGSRYLALQRLARKQGRPTAELLQLYVLESFLRRLARSPHREQLVLKGGMLLAAFDLRRATRDVDLLALRGDSDPQTIERVVVEIASIAMSDGVQFLFDAIVTDAIRDDDVYPGVRVAIDARLATARVRLSVDFNVGDPVVPAPASTFFPVLLGDEPIELLAYPMAMVVAEKVVTAVQRGAANTRWRDFSDLLLMVDHVGQPDVTEALHAVARHRGVTLVPLGEALAAMPKDAQTRWATWLKRQAGPQKVPDNFGEVLAILDEKTSPWIAQLRGPGESS